MSEDAKAKATTLFGRVIHSAEEWKAIEDETTRLHGLLAERARELEQLVQTHDALANRLEGAQRALEEERARRARADREFAANFSELEARRTEDARAAAARRERDAETAKAAVDSEAERAEAAEARARDFEATIARLERESATNLERLEREHAATLERLEGEHAAKLERLEREHAVKVEALDKANAANATSLKDATAGLATALRDRDSLRQKLAASEAEASSAASKIAALEKSTEGLRAESALRTQELAKEAARAKADRASMAAKSALAGRLVRGIAELATIVLGAGARTFWRWSTGKRGADLTPADLSALFEALGVSTEVAFELEESGVGVLRLAAPAGADAPAWALAITEAVLFHRTARSYAAPVARNENGKVLARFEPLEDSRAALGAELRRTKTV